jgi:hypothetical protein
MSTTAVHGGQARTGDAAVRRFGDVDNVIRRVRIAYIRELLARHEYVCDRMIDVTAERILSTRALGNDAACGGSPNSERIRR